jgi:hypothetical protein
MSGDIFVFHTREWGSTGIWWIKATESIKYPIVHRTAPHNKELLDPKCYSAEVKAQCPIPLALHLSSSKQVTGLWHRCGHQELPELKWQEIMEKQRPEHKFTVDSQVKWTVLTFNFYFLLGYIHFYYFY